MTHVYTPLCVCVYCADRGTQATGPSAYRFLWDVKTENGKRFWLVAWEGTGRDSKPYEDSWQGCMVPLDWDSHDLTLQTTTIPKSVIV